MDKGPNYIVERRRLEISKLEHQQTINKQTSRTAEISAQKQMNLARAELANLELDAEAENISVNQDALTKKIAEIDKNLSAMTKSE